ncbi:hypothetical protein IB238_02005 [Rhizobium sp. ARZ01]|uniref:hypothetical protein n=1 Tax=Rhizobium sp. ARZ01 TaxID=2769313 RepID=UPI001785D82F|nr:hypothetical protein [Rhizobium sp. ARZ01]MBD9371412.1 hypothetical protein [Rhizobium sp. ARZ01]
MFKYFFSRTRRAAAPLSDRRNVPADWIRDPLAHPQIEAMDERQRGDLPFRAFPTIRDGCLDTPPCG